MSKTNALKIDEVEARQKIPLLIAKIIKMGDVEETPSGKKVMDIIISDDTGQIKLKLWEEDINKFDEGDKVQIRKGYCKTYMEEKYITTGHHGELQKIPSMKPKK